MLRRLLSLVLAVLLLAGCLPHALPMGAPATAPAAIRPVQGRIGTMPGYHAQLTDLLNDFAKGATVSLIEVSSGNTVATSLADAQGNFSIQFGSGFKPTRLNPTDTRSVAYYMEAVRGVKGPNPLPNQAGASAIRLRTLIWYDFTASGWVSLGNGTPGSITISLSTTSVAFYINQQVLKALAITPESYIGCVDPTLSGQAPNDYRLSGTLTQALYSSLFTQVTNAVINDQDPIQAIVIDSNGTAINTQTSFTVSGLSATTGAIGQTITINGQKFSPSAMTVEFVGATASINVGASSATLLTLTVPQGARSGLVRVAMNGISTYTGPFTVTTNDGHLTSFTDGTGTYLYGVSNDTGTLFRINPDGSTTTLSTALNAPRSVLVNPEGVTSGVYSIYVADPGTGQIVRMDSGGNVLNATWLAVTNVDSLALGPDGDLYVSQSSSNQIRRVRVNWATGAITNATVATYTGFSGPSGLAFDPGGYLYAVENAAGQVVRFQPQASDSGTLAASLTLWAVVYDARGIAIDTAGDCFVTSQANSDIYRVDPYRNMTSFAAVDSARSLARDAAGNLYVADNGRNLVRRVTLTGDQRIVAYGLAGLTGLTTDGSGNVLVSLQNSGAILKLQGDGKTTSPFITGISAPSGLTLRNGKVYVAHTLTGNVTEVSLTGSARSVIPSGLHSPGGVEVSDDSSTYYVSRLNLADSTGTGVNTTNWYTGGWASARGYGGLDVVNNGTFSWSQGLIRGRTAYYGPFDQQLVMLDSGHFVLGERYNRRITLMTTLSGAPACQGLTDVTPTFAGTQVFPGDINDLAYDGTRYLYVACTNNTIYRIDTQNYAAAPGVISLSSTPYGLGFMAGVLYVTDRTNHQLLRVTNPAAASGVDAWSDSFGTALAGVVAVGSYLYVTDPTGGIVWQVDPSTSTNTQYASGLNQPYRIRAYNDGRLLIYGSGAQAFTVTAANTYSTSNNWSYEYWIDGSNNIYYADYAQQIAASRAIGMYTSHELARDPSHPTGNWLYVATYGGVYGTNLSAGGDMSVNFNVLGAGTPYGLAVQPTTHDLYVLTSTGKVYSIDATTRAPTLRTTLPGAGWGLDYDANSGLLYAACSANNLVYRIDPSNWAGGATALKVGLHAPLF